MPLAPRRSSVAATTLAPLLAVVLALCCCAAEAQYKWKDSRGQLHASDQPPPRDIPDKDVLQRPVARPQATAVQASAPAASAAALRAPIDPELQQRRARAEQEAKARAKADEDRLALQRADNCQRARQQLATLDSGTRLVRVNEQGERIALDDAARASEMAQARNVIASECR